MINVCKGFSKCWVSVMLLLAGLPTLEAQWSELGGTNTSTFNFYIQSLITDRDGNIDAAGFFVNNIGYSYVAKWNGTGWGILGGAGATFNSGIRGLAKDNKGNVYACGGFTNGKGYRYIAKWNGTKWTELGGGDSSTFNDAIVSVAPDARGNVYAGGYFSNGPDHLTGNRYIAKWDGNSWAELGGAKTSTFTNSFESIVTDAKGNVYAAGNITNNVNKYYVAKWDGSKWSELGGTDLSPFNGFILGLTFDNNGNLYAVGSFKNAKGKGYVAKWNGTVWEELGGKDSSMFNDYISTIFADDKGSLYVAGNFTNNNGKQYVAKWDGKGWQELGGTNSSICNNIISSLTVDSVGNVYAAGQFTNIKGNYFVAKYTYPLPAPLTLASFSARPIENHQIKTEWQTATETNTARFHLQRSGNATEGFATIATLQAAGNSTHSNHYSYTDIAPLQGISYYRLQSVDKDGSSSYSKIIPVTLTTNNLPLITITPNPARNYFTLQLNSEQNGKAVLQLIDAGGKSSLVRMVALSAGENKLKIDIAALAKGSYRLLLTKADKQWERQLVKE